MKKQILVLLSASLLLCGCSQLSNKISSNIQQDSSKDLIAKLVPNKALNNDKEIGIYGHNLSLNDSIDLIYYAITDTTKLDFGLLVWKNVPEAYTYENAEYIIKDTSQQSELIDNVYYDVYRFENIAAKEMSKYIYAVVYSYDSNSQTYTYSEPDKYSVLDYCLAFKNSTQKLNANATTNLGQMCQEILDYGAMAQTTFAYNTNRLANATFYNVSLSSGSLIDGFSSGLYTENEDILFKEDYWEDQQGNYYLTNTLNMGDFKKNLIFKLVSEDYTRGMTINGNTLTSYGDCRQRDVIIPKSITEIGENAFANTDITSIFIPSTVTKIGKSAFMNCNSLSQIIIPDSVLELGEYCFSGCSLLINATLSNNLVEMGKYCFENCSLNTLSIPSSLETIKPYTFRNNIFTNVTFPDGVLNICEYAFIDCPNLKTISISKSVANIDCMAFSGCQLGKITIDAENTIYDSRENCNAIVETSSNKIVKGSTITTFPNTIIEIGEYAFSKIQFQNSKIILPTSITAIHEYSFFSSNISELVTGDGLITISQNAFESCTSLTAISLGSNITHIGASAFAKCRALPYVYIPTNVLNMGYNVFYGCNSLTSIDCAASKKPENWHENWFGNLNSEYINWGVAL